jgi:hypothetical protein
MWPPGWQGRGLEGQPTKEIVMRRAIPGALLLSLLSIILISPALADARRDGTEQQVNSYTTDKQREPAVARGEDGTFLVVWVGPGPGSPDGIFGRFLDGDGVPLGTEFQVNTWTTTDDKPPSIASRGTEGFVVTWAGRDPMSAAADEILAILLDSTGAPMGSEFHLNGITSGSQERPKVAADDSGGFVVVWEDGSSHDGDGYSVWGRVFDSAGAPIATEFQVNEYTTGYQWYPDVAWSRTGDILVSWTSEGDQDGDGGGVFARLVDPAGFPAGGEFQINTWTTGAQYDPQVAVDRQGDFAVIWRSDGPDGSGDSIQGQMLDGGGSPFGPEFQINTHTSGNQRFPAVAMSERGEMVVTWNSYAQDGSNWGVFGQRYDPTGLPRGGEFEVNTWTTGSQLLPEVAIGDSGEFVVVWQELNNGFTDYDVHGQKFAGPGPSLTSLANGDTIDCSDPANSQPVFDWIADGYEKFRIFMGSSPGFEKGTRVTSGDRWIRNTSWAPSRKKWKKACRKVTDADPFSPLMYIAIQALDQDLSKSDPTRLVLVEPIEVDVTP